MSERRRKGVPNVIQQDSTHIPIMKVPDVLENIAESTKEMLRCTGMYVETEASERTLHLVNFKGRVLLIGSRGSGKTALGLHILKKLSDRTPLLLTDPQQWHLIRPRGSLNSSEKYAVFIDDIIGKNTLNIDVMDHWERLFKFIEPMICSGQVVVIASSASIIVNRFCERSTFLNFFSAQSPVDIDSIDLTSSQKEELFLTITKYSHRFSREEIKYLTSITLDRRFISCCQFFSTNLNVYWKGLEFFKRPVEMIDDDLEVFYEMKQTEYMSLLWILYQTAQSYLEDTNIVITRNNSWKRITSLLPETRLSKIEFRRAADSLRGTFLKYIPETNSYEFIDQTVHDAVARNFLSKFPEIGMSLCPFNIVVEYSCLLNVEQDNCLIVPIKKEDLAKRFSLELEGSNFEYVIRHAAFRDGKFLEFMDRNGYINAESLLIGELKREISSDFNLFFRSNMYSSSLRKILSYTSKFSLTVMTGLKTFSHYILKHLLVKLRRCQQKLVKALPCLCYVGDSDALLTLKHRGIKPDASCLLACAAAPRESLEILQYVCQNNIPNSEMLGVMLSITLQQGYGESSRFLLDELSKYRNPSLMTNLFHQIVLQCHGKDGRIFRESESGIALDRNEGAKIDWEKYIDLDHFVSKLSENVQESDAKWLILKAAGTSLCSAVEKLFQINPSLVLAETSSSKTLLHLSCKYGSKEMVELLLCKDIDCNQRDVNGYLALHYAATSLYDPIGKVQLLIQKGLDIGCKTMCKKSLLHLASASGLYWVLQDLLIICSRGTINDGDEEGNTPLHLTSGCTKIHASCHINSSNFRDFAKCASLLIDAGALVNMKNKWGKSAFNLSAMTNKENVMNVLIQNGADVNELDEYGDPPLFLNARSVPFLVSKGSDFNIRNDDGNTVLHAMHLNRYEEKHLVATDYDTKDIHEAMKVLKEKGADVNIKNYAGQTCLHVAISQREYIESLLDCHIDENITDNKGKTVHHYFTGLISRDVRCLKRVLQMEMKNRLDKNGDGAMHLTAAKGYHISLACFIEKGADVNFKNHKQQTALHIATEHGYWKLINLLLQSGARLYEQDMNGETPLHTAVHRNLTDVVKVLTGHHTCRHDIRDCNGNIPLHTACYENNFDMMNDLVGNVTNLCIKDKKGNTPIHLLVSKKTNQLEPYLKTNGLDASDIPDTLLEQLSSSRQNRLRCQSRLSLRLPERVKRSRALQTNFKNTSLNEIYDFFQSENDEKTILLTDLDTCEISLLDQSGSSEESLNMENRNCRAVLIEPFKVTISLIQQCSDLNIQNNEGNTPLHLAALSGSWKIVRELLTNGAEVRRNIKGETPLHLAVYRDHIMTVKLLLHNEVDREGMDSEGNTPIHLAGHCGHLNVLLLLLASASSEGVKQLKRIFKQDISKQFQRPEIPSDLIGSFDLETQNTSGETVLHAAVRGGWLKLVKGLLLLGSSLVTRNNAGLSATDLARLNRNPSQFKTYSRMVYLLKRASESG